MGVYGQNSCNKNNQIYPFIYFIMIISLIIIGSLYETKIIPRTTEYTEKSVWWYGAIGVLCIGVLLIVLNLIFFKLDKTSLLVSENIKTYIWYLSHILCYMSITLVSPGQWPFWLAIGILWEWFECYGSSCNLKIGKFKVPISCSGFYDITANLAGIAIAHWIRSEIPIDTLLKK
jgi:hypothetical protein